MASIRIGFSSDFVLKNGVVGLGTTVGSTTDGKLELDNGALRANLSVSGVATLTAYGGFVAQQQHVNKPATIGFGTVGVGTYQQYYETTTEFTDLGGVHHGDDQYFNTLSEDLVIDDGQILNITNTDMVGVTTIGEYDPHNHSSYVCAGSLEQVSVTGHFSVPNGGTNDRQETPIEGTVRFNTDLNTLEFFNGNEWRQFTYIQQSGNGLCLFGGGTGPGSPHSDVIQSVNIHTTGNTTNFGTLSEARDGLIAVSSPIRGVFCGGAGVPATPTGSDIIDYVAFASGGKAEDFGNLQQIARYPTAGGNGVRALIMGGQAPTFTTMINAININSKGNAIDTGGEYTGSRSLSQTVYNNQRMIMVSGFSQANQNFIDNSDTSNIIETIIITSSGSAVDWGSELYFRSANGISNSTRGIIGCGRNNAGVANNFEMMHTTIESSGHFVSFGDLSQARSLPFTGASCTLTRGVFAGGNLSPASPSRSDVIDYVQFSSLGNAVDFGDLSAKEDGDAINFGANISNAHGGLGLGGF